MRPSFSAVKTTKGAVNRVDSTISAAQLFSRLTGKYANDGFAKSSAMSISLNSTVNAWLSLGGRFVCKNNSVNIKDPRMTSCRVCSLFHHYFGGVCKNKRQGIPPPPISRTHAGQSDGDPATLTVSKSKKVTQYFLSTGTIEDDGGEEAVTERLGSILDSRLFIAPCVLVSTFVMQL
jgi:hypothetical protein